MNLKYKRVLLKLSGESLSGKIGHGIDFDTVVKICEPIKKIVDMGCEVAIVVGGGNFWQHGPYPCRPHGHAGYGHQCARRGGRP